MKVENFPPLSLFRVYKKCVPSSRTVDNVQNASISEM